MQDVLAFALAAGTLAALNPCGFAMLPAYLALFVAGGPDNSQDEEGATTSLSALSRALAAAAAMTVGFLLVFTTFGLVLTPVASAVQRWIPMVTVVIGVGLVSAGVLMLTGRNLQMRLPRVGGRSTGLGRDPTRSVFAMTTYGVAYAIASLGCTIGPFLVVTATTFSAGDIATGVAAYAAYAAGMGLVVATLAVGAAMAGPRLTRSARRLRPHLNRASGALMVLAGAYVAWYGAYELRVFAGGDANDPVITAATRVQGLLVSWAAWIGAGGFALILAVVTALVAIRARRRRRVDAPATPPNPS